MRGFVCTTLGFAALVAFERVGSLLAVKLELVMPGSVVGFVLLALALGVLKGVPQGLQKPTRWLLSHLPLFLAPALFSAVVAFNLDRSLWLFFVLSCVAGTLVSAWGVALLVLWVQRRFARAVHD